MGAVYRAQDLTLGREIALKFLPADMVADAQARRRLLKEAQAASRLNHPNIATIYEVSESGDAPFIAMELVSGATLKQILQRGALDRALFFDIARQIAEGLEEAHKLGVFHRDIKPANIMLDARSRVKILDFGLAALARQHRTEGETEETFATRTSTQNSTGGTVPYMSPEQLGGEPADARSDIFSYGVLLYECLAGRLPFRGETSIDVLHAILRTPHVPLRTLVPGISPEWEKLVDRCLAKSPTQRWASMDEVLAALRQISAPSLAAAPSDKSLAVLYFANLSGDKDDEYFRDGMTEDVITELAKIKELQLFPRSSVIAFRDKQLPATQIGQQLGAAYVLDGSLRRAGNRLRITAQLAETRTGHSVWAERYDRELKDVFEIQDEIAQSIAAALRVMLTEKEKHEIEKVPTSQVQAYDYYLRGRQLFYSFRRKDLETARQLFARAAVIDPGYARAFAGVADCSSILYMYCDASDDNLGEAAAASRRAVELDPDSAEAHTSRGIAETLRKDFAAAQEEFEIAIRLNPDLYDALYFYGRSFFAQGNMQRAAEFFAKAARVNPGDYQARANLGGCLKALGRLDEARRAYEESWRAAELAIEADPKNSRALYLGAGSLIGTGDVHRGMEWLSRAIAVAPEETGTLYNVACSYSILGEKEKAIEILESAVRNGFGHKEWIENDPDFARLRGEPRFVALIKHLGNRSATSSP